MRPFLFSLGLLFCAPTIVVAQADYFIGDTLELPTLANRDADHAVIAVNRYGDVVVANHTSVGMHSKAVEANVITPIGRSATDGFSLHNTILVGDPTLNIFSSGADSCTKPDVEALSDNSFVLVWSRHDLSLQENSRLETCRIFTRDLQGNLLNQPKVIRVQRGEGFVINDTSTSGEAGFMPDIAAFTDSVTNRSFVVYAHEQENRTLHSAQIREYEIRVNKIDWPMRYGAPDIGNTISLESGIPIDNYTASPYNGGLVLPDAVIDDFGHLVVVFEQYVIAPHLGHSGTPHGTIQMRRYLASPLSLLDSIEFQGYTPDAHSRRPMIATSDLDSSNDILLSYVDLGDNRDDLHRAHFKKIRFSTSASGHSAPLSLPWDESVGIQDDLPNVAKSGNAQMMISSRTFPNSFKLSSMTSSPSSLISNGRVQTQINYPWRPAAKIFDFNNFSVGYYAFEGANIYDPSQYKVYFKIQKLN
ncbi:MAG: hypothetical protein QGF46_04850 [Planctomycetota bacterium]|nr:hypothetical protein [Planctomycetota bacterium]